MLYRGSVVSHETVREWCIKFSRHFKNVIKKREARPSEKWHLDEQTIRLKGKPFILWRAVDSKGYELDVFLRKRRNKKAAPRFLIRLLKCYPQPKVIVTDKTKKLSKAN